MSGLPKEAPRVLTDPGSREMARRIRDAQWAFMERASQHDPLWWCTWDKAGRYRDECPEDVFCTGLIGAVETFGWIDQHRDWWIIGDWDDEHYAMPVRLTEAGIAALATRSRYDMEPVLGGMVEPGWSCIPAERSAA